MNKIHVINQYVYPDGSPVCLVVEQIANYLYDKHNTDIIMVGGSGEYRPSNRPKPNFSFISLPTASFKRDNMIDILKEYFAVYRAFKNYVKVNVKDGDTLVITSSPFLNIMLRNFVKNKKVRTIFWLFDYFPASMKSMKIPFLYNLIKIWWNKSLEKYDSVIKISGNLGYFGNNAVVHRLWNMIDIQADNSIIPEKKALYAGNLGLAHDVESLVKEFEKLRERGYEINIRADGPGVGKLPDWLKARTKDLYENTDDLVKAFHEHEIHLITGTPGTDELSFPSKSWNSIASGRTLIASGFSGAMLEELEIAVKSDYKMHLPNCAMYILQQSKFENN